MDDGFLLWVDNVIVCCSDVLVEQRRRDLSRMLWMEGRMFGKKGWRGGGDKQQI